MSSQVVVTQRVPFGQASLTLLRVPAFSSGLLSLGCFAPARVFNAFDSFRCFAPTLRQANQVPVVLLLMLLSVLRTSILTPSTHSASLRCVSLYMSYTFGYASLGCTVGGIFDTTSQFRGRVFCAWPRPHVSRATAPLIMRDQPCGIPHVPCT
jgi:hypothetical protein